MHIAMQPMKPAHRLVLALSLALLALDLLSLPHPAHALVHPKPSKAPPRAAAAGKSASASSVARARAGGAPTGPRTAPDHAVSLPNWCSAGPYARDDEPLYTTMTRTDPYYKIYHNAYWHAHKWYALLPPDAMARRDAATPDQEQPSSSSSSSEAAATTPDSEPSAADSEAAAAAPDAAAAAGGDDGDVDGDGTDPAGDGPRPLRRTTSLEEGLSVNCALISLPVGDIGSFTDNLRAGFLPGTTLLVDFPFPAFPDNLGHWAEIMLTTFSVLAEGAWRNDTSGYRSRFVDRILLPNIRKEMNDWFKEVLALAVAPGMRRGGAPVPPIIDISDLEAYPKLSWLAIENLLVIQDRYTHPERKTGFIGADHGDLWRYDGCARYVNRHLGVGFTEPRFAEEFRAAAYKRANLPTYPGWTPGSPPAARAPGSQPLMTLVLTHEDYPPLVNWEELQSSLRRIGTAHGLQVRTVTLSTDAPFVSHLDTFARSSVVVARHGPLLATAPLLPPGSAVFELLPYKWEWLGISKLYYNMTQSAGDLHHFAWRPLDYRLAHYDHENYTRYHTWTPEECSARECLMVHARAGLTVDLSEFESLLEAKLPGVVAGSRVEELREPWPKAV